ncbi:MAG: hypothetical protein ACXADY_26610 [Candidatus Hodarchaeales archaeon]
MSSCKLCLAERARVYRASPHGFEITRKAEEKHRKSEKGQITRIGKLDNARVNDKAKDRRKAYNSTDEGKAINREKTARYRLNNPIKSRCRLELKRAIDKAEIERGSCVICSEPNAEGHHEDYSKPLEVIWLCKSHHTELHFRRNRRLK